LLVAFIIFFTWEAKACDGFNMVSPPKFMVKVSAVVEVSGWKESTYCVYR
jgi:hypothetical protein